MALDFNILVDVKNPTFVNKPISQGTYIAAYQGTAYGASGGDAPTDKFYLCKTLQDYKDTFGWANGTDSDTPDTDYTGEQIAYLHFVAYGTGPLAFKNVYDSTSHPGGVGDVDATDFTASDITTVIQDTNGSIPDTYSVPKYGEDTTLFTAMKATIDLLGILKMYIVTDYDETETTPATVISALGAASPYRFDNCAVCWPPQGGYSASIHRICARMKRQYDSTDKMPFRGGHGFQVPTAYLSTDVKIDLDDANSLQNVGCNTMTRDIFNGTIRHFGTTTAFAYSGNTEFDYLKDSEGSRLQGNYNHNELVRNLWNDAGNPLNLSNLKQIVNKVNDVASGQTRAGATIGYQVYLNPDLNTPADLQAYKVTVSEIFLPAGPINQIIIETQIDLSLFNNLFT